MKEYPQDAIDALPSNAQIVGWGDDCSLFHSSQECFMWLDGVWIKGSFWGDSPEYIYALIKDEEEPMEAPIEKVIAFEQDGKKYVIKIGRNTNDELYRIITPNAPKEVLELFDIIFGFFYKQEV